MSKLLLTGAGGHCQSVLDSLNHKRYTDIVIIDLPGLVGQRIRDFKIVGTDDDLPHFYSQGYHSVVITLGNVGNPERRIALYRKLKEIGFDLPYIIDPTAIVSNYSTKEEGVFIGKGAIVNTNVKLGCCSIVNTGAIIDHDCSIGRFVNVGPGACLSGSVTVGQNTFIGVGSKVIQSVNIGKNTIIGAGSVVVRDIPDNVSAFGVPCRVKSSGALTNECFYYS